MISETVIKAYIYRFSLKLRLFLCLDEGRRFVYDKDRKIVPEISVIIAHLDGLVKKFDAGGLQNRKIGC